MRIILTKYNILELLGFTEKSVNKSIDTDSLMNEIYRLSFNASHCETVDRSYLRIPQVDIISSFTYTLGSVHKIYFYETYKSGESYIRLGEDPSERSNMDYETFIRQNYEKIGTELRVDF
jgi:hypothetical protein